MEINIDKKEYLEAANDPIKATRFWNNHNKNPNPRVEQHDYFALRQFLFSLLEKCKEIDLPTFQSIHKGNPYYYIGICSYLLDDYQTALYFFDASLTQDLNAHAHPKNDKTPSTHFIMLEGDEPRQAAKRLTKDAETRVIRALNHYNKEIQNKQNKKEINIETFREKFIFHSVMSGDPGLRTLITALVTFCLEWDFRNKNFDVMGEHGTSEPFFLHLFQGCILFESLLKHNPDGINYGETLGQILRNPQIIQALGIQEIKRKVDVNGRGIPFILEDALIELNNYKSTIDETIRITFIVRNTLGHSLSWNNNFSQDQYRKLYLIIMSSCLHVINCLWNK